MWYSQPQCKCGFRHKRVVHTRVLVIEIYELLDCRSEQSIAIIDEQVGVEIQSVGMRECNLSSHYGQGEKQKCGIETQLDMYYPFMIIIILEEEKYL
jgi:hypothetical protein